MRWDFTLEHRNNINEDEYEILHREFHDFLLGTIEDDNWLIWVAEEERQVVSHAFLEVIHKVPRPGRIIYPFAYLTNVYTLPDYRNKGIGSKLLSTINDWVKDKKYVFIIVWPGEESIDYYKRNGFQKCEEPLVNTFYEW